MPSTVTIYYRLLTLFFQIAVHFTYSFPTKRRPRPRKPKPLASHSSLQAVQVKIDSSLKQGEPLVTSTRSFSKHMFVAVVLQGPFSIPSLERLFWGHTYQKMTPLLFRVPLSAVEDQACVYGDLTASGIAGGLAGEYTGRVCLDVLVLYDFT